MHSVHLCTGSMPFSHISCLFFFNPFFSFCIYCWDPSSTNTGFPGPAVVNTMIGSPHSVIIIVEFDWHRWLCLRKKNMNIYSISISHGKNSSHITYIHLNHPWSINRLRRKALDWLREWLTAERVEPLNVKLKGKMGSVFVQVPRGEKPGFCTHARTSTRAYAHTLTARVRSHIVILLYFGLCSTWKHFMLPPCLRRAGCRSATEHRGLQTDSSVPSRWDHIHHQHPGFGGIYRSPIIHLVFFSLSSQYLCLFLQHYI